MKNVKLCGNVAIKLAQLNYDRVLDMDLNYRLTPAIFSYGRYSISIYGDEVYSARCN